MKKYLLLSLCFLITSISFGSNKTVKKGIKKYEKEHFEQAIELLSSVVADNSSSTSEEDMALARYYLSKSYYESYIQEPSDKKVLNYLPKSMELLGNPSTTSEYVGQKKISEQRKLTASSIWNEANNLWKLSQHMDSQNKENNLKKLLTLTASMDSDLRNNYNVHHLEGKAYLNLGDSLKAYNSFKNATSHYNSKPEEIYQMIAYDYYQLALLQKEVIGDGDQALKWVYDGMAKLSNEKAKMNWNKMSFEEESHIERQFRDINRNMRSLEYAIYDDFPAIRQDAIYRVSNRLEDKPDDYDLNMSYARLMEHFNGDDAIAAYKRAIKVHPLDFDAHYGIALIHIARAKQNQKLCVEECVTNGLEREIEKDTKAHYKAAIPYLEVAYSQRSCNSDVLLKLVEACEEADETERYVRYDSHMATCY